MIPRAISSWAMPKPGALALQSPMVFIAGPRQVGKTALARTWSDRYFNWDTIAVRRAFSKDPQFYRTADSGWIVFDEIHKRRDWKRLLKGYFDDPDRNENFVVTGSGRFDTFQKGGDSLQGRYELFHLMPLSPDEILGETAQASAPRNFSTWQPDRNIEGKDESLIRLGGFPVPFLSQSETRARRFRDLYLHRLVREDVRDFSATQRVEQLELLARLLPERITSPLSYQNLAGDIEASPLTIKSWLRLFETLFFGFHMKPWHRLIHRAVKREPKWYFYDWAFAEAPGAVFENYLAVQLKTATLSWTEQGHGRYEVFYLRDQDRREVDFLIARDLKPCALIEAKVSYTEAPTALKFYCQKLKVPGFVIYPKGQNRKFEFGYTVNSATFLKSLLTHK